MEAAKLAHFQENVRGSVGTPAKAYDADKMYTKEYNSQFNNCCNASLVWIVLMMLPASTFCNRRGTKGLDKQNIS